MADSLEGRGRWWLLWAVDFPSERASTLLGQETRTMSGYSDKGAFAVLGWIIVLLILVLVAASYLGSPMRQIEALEAEGHWAEAAALRRDMEEQAAESRREGKTAGLEDRRAGKVLPIDGSTLLAVGGVIVSVAAVMGVAVSLYLGSAESRVRSVERDAAEAATAGDYDRAWELADEAAQLRADLEMQARVTGG